MFALDKRDKFVNFIHVISDLIKFTIVKLIAPIFENCALNYACIACCYSSVGPSLFLRTKYMTVSILIHQEFGIYNISFNTVV
jgi:hypothetical protein